MDSFKCLVSLTLLSSFLDSCSGSCTDDLKVKNPYLPLRFEFGVLEKVCEHQSSWESEAESKLVLPRKSNQHTLSYAQGVWLQSIWYCADLNECVCGAESACEDAVTPASDSSLREKRQILSRRLFRPRRIRLNKAVRKEYRLLSEKERQDFHSALNALKSERIDGLSKYDILIVYHTPERSPGAHFGPAFLPFHRELLKQLEVALRRINPQLALPYWDSTLEQPLPAPRDSVIWTEDFFGNGDGEVVTGPFAEWETLPDAFHFHLSPRKRIVRHIGESEIGSLYSKQDLETIWLKSNFSQLTYCVDPFMEMLHGTIHFWVGGYMDHLRISPNDPSFFLLHSFVDYIWEEFRQRRQTRSQRESDYPSVLQQCNYRHAKESRMRPFRIQNKDGLSNEYTDMFYSYQPSASCSWERPSCNSAYLFCDTRHQTYRCVSKVKLGGNCTGFENDDICYKGVCRAGRCLPSAVQKRLPAAENLPKATSTSTTPIPSPSTAKALMAVLHSKEERLPRVFFNPVTTSRRPFLPLKRPPLPKTVWLPITVKAFTQDGMIDSFTSANIITNHSNGVVLQGEFGSPSKKPFADGSAFAQMLNPLTAGESRRVDGRVRVQTADGADCVAHCRVHPQRPLYRRCPANVVLSADPRVSDQIPFTPFKEQARFLNWKNGRKFPDPFFFICIPPRN